MSSEESLESSPSKDQPSKKKKVSKGFTFPENAIILPRNNNKGIPKCTNLTYSEDNVKLYSKLVDTKACIDYSVSSNKKQHVMNFIDDNLADYVVFEYNEKKNIYEIIDESHLNEVV